jgi:hypothetical protein
MRLTPGAIWLRMHQKFQHGLRVAWYRDVVRPRILKSPPVGGFDDLTCEIHALTSENDWLNLIWALKSFYRFSGRRYALCIHEDGTLSERTRNALTSQFPDARLIGRAEADERAIQQLAGYPRCLAFRMSNPLAMKVFDFLAWLRSDRLLLIDSDVLFFASPDALLGRIEDPNYRLNSVNPDVSTAYTVKPEEVHRRLGLNVPERFNSGLGLIHRDSMRLDWFEEFLGLPGILSHHWQIEQTLFALCSARFGVELLPQDYAVRLDTGLNDGLCRHYVGRIRHLMYGEGMARLAATAVF